MTQAETLGRWAARQSLEAVYSSDLSRAVLTATPSARALKLPVCIDERLREVHFGQGEGMTRAEMRDAFPDVLERFHRHPARSPLPEGETGIAAIDRAWPALDDIAAEHPGGSVLVVMHSTLMRLILCRFLGMDPDRYRDSFPSVQNAAITTVSIGSGKSALHGYNVPTD